MLQLGARFIFRPSRILCHDGRARSFGGGRARSGYSFFDKPRAGVANRTARQPHEQRIHINGPVGLRAAMFAADRSTKSAWLTRDFAAELCGGKCRRQAADFHGWALLPFAVDGANTLLHPDQRCGRQDMAESCDRIFEGASRVCLPSRTGETDEDASAAPHRTCRCSLCLAVRAE